VQQNIVPPPRLPPLRLQKYRIAGQTVEIPDAQWLRDLVAATQSWAFGTHQNLQTNQVFRGPDLASAATLTASYPMHHVTGTATITTISALATFSGGLLFLVNDGAWSLGTGGNIASAYTPPAGGVALLLFDPVAQLWYVPPSSLAIGGPIIGGTANDVLYVGAGGVLAQDNSFTYVHSTTTLSAPNIVAPTSLNLPFGAANDVLFLDGSKNVAVDANLQWDTNTLTLKKPLTMASGADIIMGSGSLVTTYDGVATVSEGVPSELATVDLTGQTAAIAATTLYAVPAAGQGMYRISFYGKVTTAASVSSTLGPLTITATDPADSVVVTVPGNAIADITSSINNSTATGVISGALTVYAKASTNIQYVMGFTSSGGTSMIYDLHLKCERL
jgi:hypothetical protein